MTNKIGLFVIAPVMAVILTGCAHNSGGYYGPAYYGSAYYGAYYSPLDGGLWGPENAFNYYDGDAYHRDRGDHFRRHAHSGFYHLQWDGPAYRDAQRGRGHLENEASAMDRQGDGDHGDVPAPHGDRH